MTLKIFASLLLIIIAGAITSPLTLAEENPFGTDEKAVLDQVATLERAASDLEAQAAAMQSVNPAGAQGLRDQAAAIRRQIADLKQELPAGETKAGAPAQPQINDPTYKLIVKIPGMSSDTIGENPLDYIKGIYNFGIGFGMLIAVAIIIFAGLKWTTSAGNVSAQSEAKDMILNAVFGIVMLLSAVLILRTIDPKLATLSIPKLKPLDKSSFSFGEDYAKFAKALDEQNRLVQESRAGYKEARAKADAMQAALDKKGSAATLEEKIAAQEAWLAAYKADTKQKHENAVALGMIYANLEYQKKIEGERIESSCADIVVEVWDTLCGDDTGYQILYKAAEKAKAQWEEAKIAEDAAIREEAIVQKKVDDLKKQLK